MADFIFPLTHPESRPCRCRLLTCDGRVHVWMDGWRNDEREIQDKTCKGRSIGKVTDEPAQAAARSPSTPAAAPPRPLAPRWSTAAAARWSRCSAAAKLPESGSGPCPRTRPNSPPRSAARRPRPRRPRPRPPAARLLYLCAQCVRSKDRLSQNAKNDVYINRVLIIIHSAHLATHPPWPCAEVSSFRSSRMPSTRSPSARACAHFTSFSVHPSRASAGRSSSLAAAVLGVYACVFVQRPAM